MLPRMGYISNILPEVKKHFEKFLPPNTRNEDIWFELNKVPVKWNLPLGVLLDNIHFEYDLPIHFIVHFTGLKEDAVIRYRNPDSLRFYYINSLKEANTIKYGSSKYILDLPTEKTMRLFEIVNGNGSYKDFWEINKKFVDDNLDKLK